MGRCSTPGTTLLSPTSVPIQTAKPPLKDSFGATHWLSTLTLKAEKYNVACRFRPSALKDGEITAI